MGKNALGMIEVLFLGGGKIPMKNVQHLMNHRVNKGGPPMLVKNGEDLFGRILVERGQMGIGFRFPVVQRRTGQDDDRQRQLQPCTCLQKRCRRAGCGQSDACSPSQRWLSFTLQ